TSCNAGHDGSASSGSSNSFSIQAENRFSLARFQVLRNGQVLPAAKPGPPGLSGRTLISRLIGRQPAPACWGVSVACQVPAAGAVISANQKYGGPPWRSREVAATVPSGAVSESSPCSGFSVTSMTRSGAPFHGAHGEGRSEISPAASHSGAEPCARAFPGARARTNAPAISDNAVVAAPINWRAESTGDPLPLSRQPTQSAEIMAKVDRPWAFRCAAALELEARSDQARRLGVPPPTRLRRSTLRAGAAGYLIEIARQVGLR